MDRLTIPDEHIEGGIRRTVIDARAVRKEAMTIYWALKEYEDTGLTPEEIMDGELLTGWIPVSERLPNAKEYCKNDGRFIVTDGNKVEQGLFDIYADGYNDPHWPYQSCQLIAWRPLPEPYRAED